ncbi:hypothetical protein [Azonexus sp.]|uniref:beta strand repeat-containing protein n=1 Tax=Azonexus sp. TaxID=1872668 RepID=UPI0027BA3F9F|nr:hypothetical protein [Azonexus sp.]
MALSLRLPNDSLVLKAYASLVGAAPGSTAFNEHRAFVAANGQNAYVSALNSLFANVSNADLASAIRANLGLTAVVTQSTTEAFLAANASNRVGAIFAVADVLATTTDAALATAKAAYNTGIDASYNYSVVATNYVGTTIAALTAVATSFELAVTQDKLTGTSGADLFNAYIINNSNTLQSGDVVSGGAGVDTLFAQLGDSASFAITARTDGVETIKIQAQTIPNDDTNGNNPSAGVSSNIVQVDAQYMQGVTTWQNTNSRSDLVIEDVRIADGAKTKDVTIVMESTDPGNVDFGVYFDQHSLRNSSTGNTTLTIKLMDTGAAATAATAATPLLNNPYDQFKLGINGVLTTIQLDKTAVAAADTYAALLTVFQNALVGTGVVATLGADFTITDPISNSSVTGKAIVLTGGTGVAITAPTGSGWYNTTGASVPPTSNIYTTYADTALTQTELVTSTIILDDVGRGSTGGDLVVGGLSTGVTSTSRGVERFEIEVRDNSKLQTIASTNNALREVTIKNGDTTNTDQNSGVYDPTVAGKGNLTVNGYAGSAAGNAALPGVDSTVHGNYGFTDVRLIDGSAMTGKLAFDAQISSNTISKYITLVDTAASPTADVAGTGNVNYNVKGANFDYRGGANDDTLTVVVDGGVAGSRSTVVSGQSDFTFNVEGGAGNDAITLTVVDTTGMAGSAQDWYNNQNLNNNITINAGEGNDTIRIPGAGDTTINAGAGNDLVFSDNTGKQGTLTLNAGATVLTNPGFAAGAGTGTSNAVWVFNTANQNDNILTSQDINDLRSDSNETYNLYKVDLVVSYRGLDSAKINLANTTTYKLTDLEINQAIKNAINNDATLKNLLVAKDGPANSLIVESLTDGNQSASALTVALTAPAASALGTAELLAAATAWGVTTPAAATAADAVTYMTNGGGATFAGASAAVSLAAFTTNADYVKDMATDGAVDIVGAASTSTSDNFITAGEGDDLIVLGTTVGAAVESSSNEVVVYTGAFGKDVVLNFTAAGAGMDYLGFDGIGAKTAGGVTADMGTAISAALAVTDGHVYIEDLFTAATDVVATENDNAVNVKELFATEVAGTAKKMVYVAVSSHNVGTVYQIVDGTAANDITVTELGTIDLADTNWNTLTTITSFIAPTVYADGPTINSTTGLTYTVNGTTVVGTVQNDTFNTITAGANVTGNGGNDTFNATAGASTIVDLSSGDTLNVSVGATVTSTALNLTGVLGTNAGTVVLTGTAAADTIVGTSGADTVTGGALADTINLIADAAIDTVVINSALNADADTIANFVVANDVLQFSVAGLTLNAADYAAGAVTAVNAAAAALLGAGAWANHVVVDTAANIAGLTVGAGSNAGAVLAIATDTGAVSYDLDGAFGVGAVVIGTVTGGGAFTGANLAIIA